MRFLKSAVICFSTIIGGILLANVVNSSPPITLNPLLCIDPLLEHTVVCEPPPSTECVVPECVPAGVGGCSFQPEEPLPQVDVFFETSSVGGGSSVVTYAPSNGSGFGLYVALERNQNEEDYAILCYEKKPCVCDIDAGETVGTCRTLEGFTQEYQIVQWFMDQRLPCPPPSPPE